MNPRSVIICSLLLVLVGGAGCVLAQSVPPVSVDLELSQEFFYEGDPLHMRVSVRNNGDVEMPNPVKVKLFKGLKVLTVDGRELTATTPARLTHPNRLDRLSPLSFYGGVVDLTTIYGELKQTGTYQISWSANDLASNTLVLRVIPRYDPDKRYTAKISTSAGDIDLALFGEQSPITVKAFVDMANTGFYDDLQVTEVHPEAYIVGGDGRSGIPPRKGVNYPAERSALPLVAGTVVMKPTGAAPPANGSEFMILLRPIPAWAGQVTVVGQVIEGLNVVQELSKLPSTGQTARPNFKPLQEIKIIQVTVADEAKAGSAGGGE